MQLINMSLCLKPIKINYYVERDMKILVKCPVYSAVIFSALLASLDSGDRFLSLDQFDTC